MARRGQEGESESRSMYLAQTRTRPVTFLHVFDAPDMTSDNQAQRFRSSLPAQSLAMMNSPLVMRTTRAFTAQVLEQSKGDVDDALLRAFAAAYSWRPP